MRALSHKLIKLFDATSSKISSNLIMSMTRSIINHHTIVFTSNIKITYLGIYIYISCDGNSMMKYYYFTHRENSN